MKHVFFDIDGTLWDFMSVIPDSAVSAIKQLQANGHKAYISTGRTRGYITKPNLLSIGFDGILSGCGTRLEKGEDVIYEYLIPREKATAAVDLVRSHGFRAILEGPEFLYMDYEDFKDDVYGKKVMRDLGDHLRSLSDNYGDWVISKFSCDMSGCDKEACYTELRKDFDVIEHNDIIAEMVPKGFNKGTGIKKFCELINIDIADTIAIGDGANDLDMFEAAGFSVAMGSGAEIAKNAADHITTGLKEDGIYNALKHLDLI
ncbi:MAG: HAD-IIB family hydrolase [Clostridiales bacterium]|nr:HAD-IIB family hydrolase [Clostridiales bacterium]